MSEINNEVLVQGTLLFCNKKPLRKHQKAKTNKEAISSNKLQFSVIHWGFFFVLFCSFL